MFSPHPFFMTISIHVPARGTTPAVLLDDADAGNFNPRTRTGYDPGSHERVSKVGNFNPRTRTGYDARCPTPAPVDMEFQSTYPHGVRRRPARRPLGCGHSISIHVPARGTTRVHCHTRPRPVHFNPRTRTGYDLIFLIFLRIHLNFNPRTRTGYDAVRPPGDSNPYISIHVPARGTTSTTDLISQIDIISIHVPARGTTRYHGDVRR